MVFRVCSCFVFIINDIILIWCWGIEWFFEELVDEGGG